MGKVNTAIYRMTHIENIKHILEFGITQKTSINSNPNFVMIGDLSLIDDRANKIVNVDNGEFLNLKSKLIKLGDYIPFYFGIKMPMLYIIQLGGNFVERASKPEDIIYLVCSIEKIIAADLDFYFSDGHGTNNFTSFYEKNKINDLNSIIDWNSIKAQYWAGNENLDLKRKKQAEFLVLNDLNPNMIIGFGCYNESAKNRLIKIGVEESKIKVIPSGYF